MAPTLKTETYCAMTASPSNVTVFVSYSHDSDAHRQRVKCLTGQMKARGIRVITDLNCPDPNLGFVRWIEEQLEAAERILMVFTETYHRRYEGKEKPGVGRGVAWEAHLIRILLYQTVPDNARIRAITVAEGDEKHIPLVLRPYRWYRVYEETEVDELCQWVLSCDQRLVSSGVQMLVAPVEAQDASPFQTVGMLPDGHPTYVPRECDRQLAEFLDDPKIVCIAINGDFEIGKSSLMIRSARVLGPDWIEVGGGLGDLRSDRPDLCVNNFFRLFALHFGQLDSWGDLGRRIVEQPVLLLLDDLGEMLPPGAQAILPRVVELALAAKGKLRVVATLPVRIDQYLRNCGLGNPRYWRPWRTLSVLPFEVPQAKRLLSLLPAEPLAVTERLFAEVERYSGLKPRPLQCLADRLWHAHRDKEDDARLTAIVRDPDSYT
jgi:hypothetical protein